MSDLFSIIIPVLHEEAWVVACLQRLRGMRRMNRAEVLLVDGGGGSTLQAVSGRDFGLVLRPLQSPPGRGVQMNAGARAASGRFLVFLHVDTRLPPHALDLVERALARHRAGAFTLRIESPRPWLLLGSRLSSLRSRLTRVPSGDQAFFLRRDLFFSVGGYPPLPIMEDVALMLALRRRGVRPVILPEPAVTSARRWEKEGAVRGTVRNWTLYLLFRLGVPARRLAGRYLPHHPAPGGGPVS
jgi:rSAM/selenodomain-associated transferase 2